MTTTADSSLLPLKAMQLPDAPSWFPLAWGWWASAAVILVMILSVILIIKMRKKRIAPKKAALRLIQNEKRPAAAIELVRQAALCYFPREEIAQLTGAGWYQFLDQQVESPLFVNNADQWQTVLYSKTPVANSQQLIEHCYQWVEEALPPKKRSKKIG